MTHKHLSLQTAQDAKEMLDVDWELAFKVLCGALGRGMISSTVLYFVMRHLRSVCGGAVVRVAVEHMALNRDKGTHGFMG